jgi:hypothetical protein
MRVLIIGIATFVVNLIIGCAAVNSPSGGHDIHDPIIPSTPSVIPLTIGSSWEYWSTWYDTSGKIIQLANRTLMQSIPGGFVMVNDTVLQDPNNGYYNNSNDNTGKYVYKLEWDNIDSGLLVRHIGSGDLNQRGLYIIGTYTHATPALYRIPVRWLAYPADKGTTYTVALPGEDSSEVVTMQVVETAATFYAPVKNRIGASPVLFKDSCYLYKETVKSTELYYYYHPDIGCIGYLKYVNNKLVVTYILTSYKNDQYGYRAYE